MPHRFLPRLLLGLFAMLTPLVNPMASVLHGLAHADEARHGHVTLRAATGARLAHGPRAPECEIEAPDHNALHVALHRASASDPLLTANCTAIFAAPFVAISAPKVRARNWPPERHSEPPDPGLRSHDLARAPPLG